MQCIESEFREEDKAIMSIKLLEWVFFVVTLQCIEPDLIIAFTRWDKDRWPVHSGTNVLLTDLLTKAYGIPVLRYLHGHYPLQTQALYNS
jgi:hypothetical protein